MAVNILYTLSCVCFLLDSLIETHKIALFENYRHNNEIRFQRKKGQWADHEGKVGEGIITIYGDYQLLKLSTLMIINIVIILM